MLNTRYRLVAPYTIEPLQVCESISTDTIVVRPTYMSICCADQRYYQSKRSASAMKQKLPMALIHESIGEVVFDSTKTFKRGTRVVMLPNQATRKDSFRSENYLCSSKFCGSGYDGFMQELCFLPKNRVVELPETIPNEIGSFVELITVALHAISRFKKIAHGERKTLGVWGDGNLGYIVSLLLRTTMPDSRVVVYGKNQNKLVNFSFADTLLNSDIDSAIKVDHAFECCGGEGSASAIMQIIDLIEPEGTISLLGVSENPIPVATRLVLEKGLSIIGSSRSSASDFRDTIDLLNTDQSTLDYLSMLLNEVIDINSIPDITSAFSSDSNKQSGKTIMRWNI